MKSLDIKAIQQKKIIIIIIKLCDVVRRKFNKKCESTDDR